MIKNIQRKYGLKNVEYWFSETLDYKKAFSISSYRQTSVNTKSLLYKKERFKTRFSDLTKSREEIFTRFSSTIRNEINRSEKENAKTFFDVDKNLFVSFFNDFAYHKKLPPIHPRRVQGYDRQFVVTSVYFSNFPVCMHAYLKDETIKRARLLYSATARFENSADRNKIGRANKLLHYHDMLKFKESRFKTYDWGGIAIEPTEKSLIGINAFKKSFGGEEVIEYNYFSYPYLWMLNLKKIR